MANRDDSGGVGALVRHTAGMAELAIHAGHPDRKYNEYLSYPDGQFEEKYDEHLQRGRKFLVAHLYDQTGRTFVPNVPVIVKSIVAQRIYAGLIELLNPYLFVSKRFSFDKNVFQHFVFSLFEDIVLQLNTDRLNGRFTNVIDISMIYTKR